MASIFGALPEKYGAVDEVKTSPTNIVPMGKSTKDEPKRSKNKKYTLN